MRSSDFPAEGILAMRKPYVFAVGLLTLVCALGAGRPARPAEDDKAAIEELEQRYMKAFNTKDVNAIMAVYAATRLRASSGSSSRIPMAPTESPMQ